MQRKEYRRPNASKKENGACVITEARAAPNYFSRRSYTSVLVDREPRGRDLSVSWISRFEPKHKNIFAPGYGHIYRYDFLLEANWWNVVSVGRSNHDE